MHAAAAPHAFAGIDMSGTPAILHTRGNPACHIILRGGRGTPNYDSATVAEALAPAARRRAAGARRDRRVARQQRQGPRAPARGGRRTSPSQIAAGNAAIVGTMLESFLVAGRQDLAPGAALTYGQSITDECMAWDTTVVALDRLADAVRTRRETV